MREGGGKGRRGWHQSSPLSGVTSSIRAFIMGMVCFCFVVSYVVSYSHL